MAGDVCRRRAAELDNQIAGGIGSCVVPAGQVELVGNVVVQHISAAVDFDDAN